MIKKASHLLQIKKLNNKKKLSLIAALDLSSSPTTLALRRCCSKVKATQKTLRSKLSIVLRALVLENARDNQLLVNCGNFTFPAILSTLSHSLSLLTYLVSLAIIITLFKWEVFHNGN